MQFYAGIQKVAAMVITDVNRGSASPVLTATGSVNGRLQFSTPPPQNPHPLTDHQKNWYRWLCRRTLRLCQLWCKSVDGGLLGKWVKHNEFFYLYLFSSTHLQVRPVDGFSRMMAQTTLTRARMCLLGVLLTLLPILGVKSPVNPNCGGVNRRFQAKRAKYWKFHVIETTASISPNFAQP